MRRTRGGASEERGINAFSMVFVRYAVPMSPSPLSLIGRTLLRKSLVSLVTTSLVVVGTAIVSSGAVPSGADAPSQGVTSTTIRVGIPYVDLSAVRQFGITLDQGSFPDAYHALIANVNAHGGIDGRKLVPYLVAVNPVGNAAAATACTQLAEDDEVLVAIAPQQTDCYTQQHGIPTIAGSFENGQADAGAPNFSLQPPAAAYDPLQLSVLARQGVFKGKHVGLFAGGATDDDELHVVEAELKSLRVPVTLSAVDSAAAGDEAASNQLVPLIVQRFKAAGVNEVVAVGTGATVWPESLENEQSTYSPPWVATNEGALATAVSGNSVTPTYLKNVVTTSPVPSKYQTWQSPAVQECYRIVRKAYPEDTITPPSSLQSGSDQTSYAVESACTNLALLTAILKEAGKNLTRTSFAQAGYKLRNIPIPGSGTPISFASARSYPIGGVYLVTYASSKHALAFSTNPVGK